MGERTKLGVAATLGLSGDGRLQAIPRGPNVFLFAPSALASGILAVALLNALDPDARTNLARVESGQEPYAPYLASLGAVPPLATALPLLLPEKDLRAVESGPGTRRAAHTPGERRTCNSSRSRAYQAISTGLPAGPRIAAKDPRGGG